MTVTKISDREKQDEEAHNIQTFYSDLRLRAMLHLQRDLIALDEALSLDPFWNNLEEADPQLTHDQFIEDQSKILIQSILDFTQYLAHAKKPKPEEENR